MLFFHGVIDTASAFDGVEFISSRSSSSQTISNDAVLQDLASRDLPAIPSEDEDDSNGQLQKRNLFQSLQHNPSHVFPTNASSLSIKSGTSSLAQPDSKNNLNTKKKKPRKFISSNFSSTYSNHSEFSQQDPFVAKPLPPEPKHDEFVKASSTTLLRRKNAMKLRGTRHDTTSDSGMPVTRPNLKSSVDDFSSVASSFKTANVSDSVGESEMEHTSLSHRGYDVPMIQPSVIQTSHSSIFLNDDNLDDQKNTSESSICSDTTLVTQHPPLTSKILQEEVVRELNVPGAFPSDKPSTSPNLHNPPLNSTKTDSIPISPKDNSPKVELEVRRKPNMNSLVLNLVTSQVVSTIVLEKVQPPKTQQWKRPLQSLQRISDVMVWRMEGLLSRRMESRNLMVQSKTSPETLSSRTAATPETEEPLRPQLQTLREDNSSKEAHIERQQALQTQLDKALAELREVQAENKRLTSENQSQQRSISHLKIALDEAKHEQQQNNNSLNNQLRDATSSLDLLNEEKKGWQDKLDSMQHKLNAAERQVRCLDHLTRRKFELRREASQSQPKRRALLSASSSIIPASTVVVDAMRVLNEEIYQTCVQFVEGLERTDVSSTKQTPQVQKVLGDHLTAMMEDHARKVTSGYNMLLMQTVLEVFMTHWCSSIIEAFYPHQESFTDLLAELSAQTTTNSSGANAICGKQVKIIQSNINNGFKFNEWVKDIINQLATLLTMAGLRMKTQSAATLFPKKTLTLVQIAYNLRTAMAEKDICGGLEVVIVPPDTPFQEKWMMDAHVDPRKVVVDSTTDRPQVEVDFVAGTTGIGLQRKVLETVDGEFQSRMEMELKPKVTLARTLNVKD